MELWLRVTEGVGKLDSIMVGTLLIHVFANVRNIEYVSVH